MALDFVQERSADAARDEQFRQAAAQGRVIFGVTAFAKPLDRLLDARPGQREDVGYLDSVWKAGSVRTTSVFRAENGKVVPALSAALALRQQGKSPADEAALRGLAGPPAGRLGAGEFWINYAGKPGTFPLVALERLAEGDLTDAERALFRGAAVIIGPTYTGSNDVHQGPLGPYHGAEIHAHALATLVDGRSLRRAPVGVEGLIALVLGVIFSLAIAKLPVIGGIAAGAVATGGWLAASGWLFGSDFLLPVAGPLISVWLAGGTHYSVRAVEEAQARRFAERLLGQHVSATVAATLLRDPEARELGGIRRVVTIVFSDIQGFTTWADSHTPEEALKMLNEFQRAMFDCVVRHDGTLDKYMGDGMMAFWNAPFRDADHARRALAAAWEMHWSLEELNRRGRLEGWPELRVRVGVNTGSVVVGNTGTEQRLNYTVIGGAVNLAARLVTVNKELGSTILLGQATYDQVAPFVECREHVVQIRGIREPQAVYELLRYNDPGRSDEGQTRRLGPGAPTTGTVTGRMATKKAPADTRAFSDTQNLT